VDAANSQKEQRVNRHPNCFGFNVIQTAWEEQSENYIRSDSNNQDKT